MALINIGLDDLSLTKKRPNLFGNVKHEYEKNRGNVRFPKTDLETKPELTKFSVSDHGLLFRNLAMNEATSTDLAAMIEKSGFGEIESLEMFKLADEKIARVVFANKNLDLENIKDAFNGIIWEKQSIFVDLIEIEEFFRNSTSRFKEIVQYISHTYYLLMYLCLVLLKVS